MSTELPTGDRPSAHFPSADEPQALSLVCPKCGAYMAQVEYAGITVDRCTNCVGLWFDYREAETLRLVPGADEQIDIGDPQIGLMLDVVYHIRCPRCNTLTERMVFDQQTHLHCECCPRCYGIFFDAGEFHDFTELNLLERILRIWIFVRA